MTFADDLLELPDGTNSPRSLHDFVLPQRQHYFPSPIDWRDEVLYFLLPDRFSDAQEASRPLLDRQNLGAARPALPNGEAWRWDRWAQSGAERFQGGTIRGIISKLEYLKGLGATTIWIGPVFKQRTRLNTYHGYGVQDFLDVDRRFGTRSDLVDLVTAAHAIGLRLILDVIFNHSGSNWLYPQATPNRYQPPYTPGRYPFGGWRNAANDDRTLLAADAIHSRDDAVWPVELQDPEHYTRAGAGNLGAGSIDDPHAEHKRSDFFDLRDFQLENPNTLNDLARCYKYWIALTDCDGFRIDTLKHVSFDDARTFCGAIKEYATNLGKRDFFLVGEIAGGDYAEDRYLDVIDMNLNAALDIGEMRPTLNSVAKGWAHPSAYFNGFDPGKAVMGTHRNLGRRHVSILDDHDHVFGEKLRFSSEAASDHQVVAGVALQLFTLGIPCIYYGTEQALAGPEPAAHGFLPEWKGSDRYLREAMFGPSHPRADASNGGAPAPDPNLPGFGPFGTAGQHCFDPQHPAYVRIAALIALRTHIPALRVGRQYVRPIAFLGNPFAVYGPGEIIAWSRILDEDEIVCVLNGHGTQQRGADVLVDPNLNQIGSRMTILLNTAQAANLAYAGPYPVGSTVAVQRTPDGIAFVAIRDLGASEVVVLGNH